MIRIISARRLRHLETALVASRAVVERLTVENHGLQMRLTTATQEWRTWEKRASRFIDQVGLKDATISAPVMTEPSPPPQSPTRQVMAALGRTSLSPSSPEPAPTTAGVLGVSESAARAALDGVLERT